MKYAHRLQRTLIALSLLTLSACSVYQFPGQSSEQSPEPVEPPSESPVAEEGVPDYNEVPESQTPAMTAPRALEPEPGVAAAYGPLLARADTAVNRGDYEQALALLERAQRIAPDNAAIYLDMARAHFARGDYSQSAATAQRGLLYCNSTQQCDALREYL